MTETGGPRLWRCCVAEAVGTFALVFAGTGAIVVDQQLGGAVTHVGIALSFGLVVMAMIYSVGETSGAHLNPAVSVGFAVAGRFPWRHVPAYWAAQFGGALLASGVLFGVFPSSDTLGSTLPGPGVSVGSAFLFELLLTAILMFVILCVAVGSKEQGLMAGIAIGGTVGLEAMFAGPVTGASMNPARSLAPALVSWTWEAQWVYVVATIAGAALAVPVWLGVRRR